MITPLSEALAERGYETLTSVQEAVTEPGLAKSDLLVSAQTGSGKTVGFGLAIAPTVLGEAERFGHAGSPLALVVAPTRELALQVQRELAWLYARTGARVVSCIGGMDAREERRALERGAHIVVGTPGRLRDHITRSSLDLSDIRAIVLDEADEMLDLGFREDLEFMLAAAPAERRTLMFSATVPPSIEALARGFQRDAVRVTTLTKGDQHADISYQVVQVANGDAENAIINLLRFHDAQTAIVFANTREAVSRLAARLSNRGFSVVSLSGELSQDQRGHALQSLRDGRARICVATDVAARGIDLPNLELVIHADLPGGAEALLHRSGRTGRAGRKGISVLIVPDRIVPKARRLLGWARIEADWISAPGPDEIQSRDEARLLADPAWEAEATGSDAAFAKALLDRYGAERVAAACLRFYRAGLSAPEELNTPGARAARDSRPAFGPSGWVALSVGRDKGAEPRWLLPLLLRTGGLEKADIGKIRVYPEETFVEVAEAAIPGLMSRVGSDRVLEDGIRLRPAEAPMQRGGSDRPKGGDRAAPKGHRKGTRPHPGEDDAAAESRDRTPPRIPTDAPRAEGEPYAPRRSEAQADAPTQTQTSSISLDDIRRPRPAKTSGPRASRAEPFTPDLAPPPEASELAEPRRPRTDGDGSVKKKPRHTTAQKKAAKASRTSAGAKPGEAPAGRRGKGRVQRGGEAPPRRRG